MTSNQEALWEVEETFWKAGTQYDSRKVDSEALFVLPGATLNQRDGVEAVNKQPRWDDFIMKEAKTLDLGEGTVLLTYNVFANREDSPTYTANISTIYKVTEEQGPQLIFHQQTPNT